MTTYREAREARILPTGPDVLAHVVANVHANLREGAATRVDFPTPWRMAKVVVEERTPLLLYAFDVIP